jgi:hypothetical protein
MRLLTVAHTRLFISIMHIIMEKHKATIKNMYVSVFILLYSVRTSLIFVKR